MDQWGQNIGPEHAEVGGKKRKRKNFFLNTKEVKISSSFNPLWHV